MGERLFAEPRFAQFFQAHNNGKINGSLPASDLALDTIAVASADALVIKNPLAGQSMSCGSCHLGAEHKERAGLPVMGVNIFGDFSQRSPVSERNDGHRVTPRNAPPLVGMLAGPQEGWGLLHWDGEFVTIEDLVKGTYLGRNFGWLPDERAEAGRHFARVIREDDGAGSLAGKYGQLSYTVLLRGTDPAIPPALRLPENFRLDVARASDDEILHGCARLVTAFLASLQFSRDTGGRHNGSPYDAFLAANRLPQAPAPGESSPEYARRLHTAVAALRAPRYIDEPSRKLVLHDQPFRFGKLELRGMRIFFRGTLGYGRTAGAGNCAECHVPPHFTDFSFHNTGVTQDEYDAVHGAGAFTRLALPTIKERLNEHERWLPPSPQHPQGRGGLLSLVSTDSPGRTDLGLWNVYGNPDLPTPQPMIEKKLNHEGRLSGDEVLALTIARFKTPTVRDLGQSAPYLHTGRLATIEEVLLLYQRMSDQARSGKLRNAPPEFSVMRLEEADIEPLAAFLRALNEDYDEQSEPFPSP